MFIKVTRTNTHGEEKVAIINSSEIIAITEVHTGTSKLFDEDGNVVQETPKAKDYVMLLSRGDVYHFTETQFAEVEKQLLA